MQFTISFCEQPEGEVSIIDYWIYSEHGYVGTYFVENKPDYSAELLKQHTRTFAPENGKVSFKLWDGNDIHASSSQPPLLGLRMKCRYGEQNAEYYIMFKHAGWSFPPDTDFSHLTPLKE